MFNFFSQNPSTNGAYIIEGADYNHIKNVLRMKEGESFFVSYEGKSDLCVLECYESDSVIARVIEENYQNTELPVKIYLFEGLPKGDKMELIIQKAVELGVYSIIPTEMKNCVVKLDEKKKKAKVARWQAISESAAKQSKRSIIPEVKEVMSFKEALGFAETLDLFLVPYESKNGMADTKVALSKIKKGTSVGILVGPEGGFDGNEIEKALSSGGDVISLGKRILRTETAAITAVSMCMLYAEMNLGGEKI